MRSILLNLLSIIIILYIFSVVISLHIANSFHKLNVLFIDMISRLIKTSKVHIIFGIIIYCDIILL